MDDFTEDLAKLALDTCRSNSRRRDAKIPLRELKQAIARHWANLRDGTIAQRAAQIYQCADHSKLANLLPALDQLVMGEHEIYGWERPREGDDVAQWSAWVLATLRWLNRERAGIAPIPRYTDAELKEWLAERQPPEQLPLF